MRKSGVVASALMAVVMAFAASPTDKPPAFDKVPAQAMKVLKGAVGKPQNSGLVFVNGKYLRPPYRVARMGTAIYINDVQVTDQVQSWRKFLATQPGYTGAVPAKAAGETEAKSLDELFADEQDDEQQKTDLMAEPEFPFKANGKSTALLQEIDNFRTEIQRKLREGNAIFFGSRYARVVVEPRVLKTLLAALPESVRDADDGVDLETRVRAKGIVFLNRTLCSELVANRPDYLKLIDRRKFLLELERMENLEKGKMQERGR